MTVQSAAFTALGIGLVLSALLLARSVFAFSHTGPRIREEVLRHYARYSAFALIRLAGWSALIIAWLASMGIFSYLSWCALREREVLWVEGAFLALASIVLFTGLQFLEHLLRIPSSIMMSSNYKMSRFYPLWRRLSVTRIRWLRIVLIGVVAVPVLLRAAQLAAGAQWAELAGVCALAIPLGAPALWAAWPHRASPVEATRGDPDTPNVLMIGCDTLRVDRVVASRRARNLTPFLDAFTRRGTVFTNCYTPLARTAPSLVSLLTGTWPQLHRIRTNYVAADATQLRIPALPELLHRNGYETAAVSDWSGSDLKKLSFGFRTADVADDQWNLRYLIRQGPKDIRLFLSLFTHNRFGKAVLPELYYLAGIPLTSHLGTETRRCISRFAREGKPFLLNVFMATAHPPFGSEYPHYTYFSDPAYTGESKFGMSRLTDPDDIIRSQREPREAFDLGQVTDLYDGCVRAFDDEVRKIVHHLEACQLARNTVVVIYSDHGMDFFEHDTWGQGNSVFGEASAKVPMIIVDPRCRGQGANERIVRTVDVVPTLLELCGVPIPEHVKGVSLVPYLDGTSEDMDLEAYFETGIWLSRPPGMPADHLSYPDLLELLEIPDKRAGNLAIKPEYVDVTDAARDRMVRKGEWKLIRLALRDGPSYELYNVVRDPACANDVSAEFGQVRSELMSKLEAWMSRAEADEAQPSEKPPATEPMPNRALRG